VARVLSTAFCVALLAATAGAFALTQGAKVELSPILDTSIPVKVFSPACNCQTATAPISFHLRHKEHIQVWMERDGKRAETLVAGKTFPRGRVALQFDGISDAGLTLPDGGYQPVVRLPHRTFTLPNTITIDTKPPVVQVRHRIYTHISPDGDGHRDSFTIHYTVKNEPAHGILIVDGHQVEFTHDKVRAGKLTWNGKLDDHLARPGNHVLEISAQDAAGNRAKPFPFAVVTIRYVALGRTRIVAKPGSRFAVLVLADAPKLELLFHGGHRSVSPGTLHLRAPSKPGVYRLYVSAAGHAAKADVVVG
jgi:hypothetical protein